MGGSGWHWRVWNFMIQTQPDLLSKKKKNCNPTQPTKPKKTTQHDKLGWVRSVLAGWWVGCTPLPYSDEIYISSLYIYIYIYK